MLALIVASMGFLSKLLAEAVEEMSMKQVEAVRATGASFLADRRDGRDAAGDAALHRLLRLSARFQPAQFRARSGLVGGGGIGATLFTAFQRFDYDFVLTIVLAIIAMVMVGEIVSGLMRRLFQ